MRSPRARRLLGTVERESARALEHPTYGRAYFDNSVRPEPGSALLSGYDTYTLEASHARFAAYLAWRFFAPVRTLDVGCALGYVVAVERELDIDAQGVDVSRWAVDHAVPGAAGRLQFANLSSRLPFDDAEFDLVTAFETLEHLPPDDVPHALAEIARVSRSYVLATIPSFGPNEYGPGGWLNGKVRWDRLEHYDALGDEYDGPIPFGDLMRDDTGEPVEGHLTVASFRWWTQRFAAAGLTRVCELERKIHPEVARFGLTQGWNLYAFARQGFAAPAETRSGAEIADVEQRLGIDGCAANPADLARVEAAALGPGPAVRTTGPFKTKDPGDNDLAAARRAGVTLPS